MPMDVSHETKLPERFEYRLILDVYRTVQRVGAMNNAYGRMS